MSAQDKKLFTLEDLNFGGTNYRNLLPQNLWLTWWGDQLMYQDAEEGGTITAAAPSLATAPSATPSPATAPSATAAASVSSPAIGGSPANPSLSKTRLFALKDIGADFHSAFSARYPYAGQPLVLLDNKKRRVLYDWQQKRIAWSQTSQGETHSDWNARSRCVAYVKGDQLYVRDADDQERQLTTDGSRDIVYGQSVHRNEFGIDKGTFWSPDGQRLAFYRMDQSMVTDYPQVDIFPRVAEHQPDKYPMAGMTSHQVTVGVYDVRTRTTVYLRTPAVSDSPADSSLTAPTPVYFTNIAWSPDAKTIYMFELNRDQNDCRLVSYDATTGDRLAELYRETSDKYVEPQHPIMFLPWDADKFIMQSQRDGYNHLYLYTKDGRLVRQLTQGPWVVQDVLGFCEKQKTVIVTTNEASPLQRNTYAVNIKTGRRTLLDNGRGSHHAVLSESGHQFYDRWTAPDVPRCIDVVHTTSLKQSAHHSPLTTHLLEAADPWADYQQPIFENGTIKAADGVTDLYYRMVLPAELGAALTSNLSPLTSKKYPTIVYVYGGPHAHNVEASWHWHSRSWETYMAQKGYIVFILDNRGSENRGRDFEQATFRQLGQVEMQDQMQGVAFLKSLPYVDADRLGVHGWSFGGFMTISLMLNYPDTFKVGVAGGPVIDWKWYEVMYGERYMDTPQQNPEGYAKTSLIAKAGQLKGKLQIITGYNDPTVVPQHCLSFLDACVKAGTQPDFFAYPGEGHNMRGHASVHLHERITQYFEDYLK